MEFDKLWEVEYIKSRVDKIAELVKEGQYERAIDKLQMIQQLAKSAEYLINSEYKK